MVFGAKPVRTHEQLKAINATKLEFEANRVNEPERTPEQEQLDAIHAAMMEALGLRPKAEHKNDSTSKKNHIIDANPRLNANVGDILEHLNLMACRRAAEAMNTERKVLNSFASQNEYSALTPLVARDTGVVIQGFPVRAVDIDDLSEARCDSILIALEGGTYIPPPHLENHIWSPPDSTIEPLPAIDKTFHHVLEEDNNEQVTEAHYRKGLCSSCHGSESAHDQEAAELLENNRKSWQDLISTCTLPLHQLLHAVVSAGESRDALVTEQRQHQERLEEIDKIISENTSQPSNNASQAWRALSSSSVVHHSRDDEDARRVQTVNAAWDDRLQVLNGLSDLEERLVEIMDNLEKARLEYQFFKDFSLLCWVEDLKGAVSREDKLHALFPGFDNSLFTIETAPPKEQGEHEEEHERCSICFSDLYGGRCRSLPCGHLYHGKCAVRWLEENNTCPICRAQFNIIRPHRYDVRLMFTTVTGFRRELSELQAHLPPDKLARYLMRRQELPDIGYFASR